MMDFATRAYIIQQNSPPHSLADLLRDIVKDSSSIAAPPVEELIREDRQR